MANPSRTAEQARPASVLPDALIECVPNFSEGRRPEVVEAIAREVESTPGARLLSHSMDPDHNRAVLTFVGSPESVVEAAFRAARVAVERIDLRQHKGQHPRIGACDVIPLIPIRGASMADCVALAGRLASRIWEELHVPTYLYGQAACTPERVRLPSVRRGGFERLASEMATPGGEPDFGEARPHPTAGAIAVGARKPLVAFNINLDTTDLEVARQIARAVRESSGGLVHVQARGMLMASRGCAQVSMNLLEVAETPLYRAFELVRLEAGHFGVQIRSSEIIELLPLEAVASTFAHYLQLANFNLEQILEWKLWLG